MTENRKPLRKRIQPLLPKKSKVQSPAGAGPAAAPPFSGIPLQMDAGVPALQLGVGVDPISGGVGTALITGIPAAPATMTANGAPLKEKQAFQSVMNYSQYVQQTNFEGNLTGYTPIVTGSLTANWFSSLAVNAQTVAITSTGLAIVGQYVPAASQGLSNSWWMSGPTVDVSAAVTALNNCQGNYETFINTYGSHFVGGYLYGTQYNAAITTQFSNTSAQTAAQGQVSAAFTTGTSGGSFQASLATALSQINGYVSNTWEQTSLGFDPAAPATLDNINANLTNFVTNYKTGGPILALLYDWRLIPSILTAVVTQPSFTFSSYLSNLPDVQSDYAEFEYLYNTAENMLAQGNFYGMLNQACVQQISSLAEAGMENIAALTPADVAVYADQNPAATYVPWLSAISAGGVNVQLACSLDGSFNPSSFPTTTFSVPAASGQTYGFTTFKNNTNPPEQWFFGFWVPQQGVVQPVQGWVTSFTDNFPNFSPQYSQWGSKLYTVSSQASETITGVGSGGGTYPWLTTSITIV